MRDDRCVTDRLLLAARNNAVWCDTVCRTHGLAGILDELAWTSPRRTPPYYPDAVTLSPEVGEYDILSRIDPSDGASVKDSWSRLDLTSEDFARLVVGEWLWWEAHEPTPRPRETLQWRRVTTPDEMKSWSRAWSADPEDAGILGSDLLAEPDVHVLAAGTSDTGIAAGCIVNVTDGVAGLSNTFAAQADQERTWHEAVAAARLLVGDMPLASWDAGAGVEAAVATGAERLGPLTVWIS